MLLSSPSAIISWLFIRFYGRGDHRRTRDSLVVYYTVRVDFRAEDMLEPKLLTVKALKFARYYSRRSTMQWSRVPMQL